MVRNVGMLVLACMLVFAFTVMAYASPVVKHMSGDGVQVVNYGDRIVLRTMEGNVNVDIPGAQITYDEETGTLTIETPSGKVKVVTPDRVREHFRNTLQQQLCKDVNADTCDMIQERIMERLQLRQCTVYDQNTNSVKSTYCYEAPVRVRARLLGIIPIEFDENVSCDAETGAVCQIRKPWWTFLTVGEEPVVEENA